MRSYEGGTARRSENSLVLLETGLKCGYISLQRWLLVAHWWDKSRVCTSFHSMLPSVPSDFVGIKKMWFLAIAGGQGPWEGTVGGRRVSLGLHTEAH